MKKSLVYLAVSASMAVMAQSAFADDYPIREGSFEISPSVGLYDYDSDRNIDDDATAIQLGLGYNITRQFAVEGVFSVLDDGLSDNLDSSGDVEVDGAAYRLDGLYHFDLASRFVPYLAMGVGNMHLDSNFQGDDAMETLVNFGGGVKAFLTDDLSLRADYRRFVSLDEEQGDGLASIGLGYQFGGHAPKVIADTDADGVTDDIDQCSDTPVGVAVDSQGCPLDSDKDGVVDSKDQCPNTLAGTKVAANGCEMDSDKDGVVDSKDQCPATMANAPVDSKGCALDSDKDGVIDLLDKCPATPAGAKIDETGCNIKITETVSINLALLFDTGSATLKPAHYAEIDKVADFMMQYPDTEVVIEGHTDAQGNAKFNQQLSQKRAESVQSYLISGRLIDASRVKAIGYGEEKPVASNATRDGRAQNRRVVAVINAKVEK